MYDWGFGRFFETAPQYIYVMKWTHFWGGHPKRQKRLPCVI
jgi:hypothetical protein